MTQSGIRYFLVAVHPGAQGGKDRAVVRPLDASCIDLARMEQCAGREFLVDSGRIAGALDATIGTAPCQPAHPQAGRGGTSWRTLPGGWATISTRPANAATPDLPLPSAPAGTAAGAIVPSTGGASWTAMPGGWQRLGKGEAASRPVPPSVDVAPTPRAEGGPAIRSMAPDTPAGAIVTATSGSASWRTMTGGWASLANRGRS